MWFLIPSNFLETSQKTWNLHFIFQVNYIADHHGGYQANVEYYGEAQYPPKSDKEPFVVKHQPSYKHQPQPSYKPEPIVYQPQPTYHQ